MIRSIKAPTPLRPLALFIASVALAASAQATVVDVPSGTLATVSNSPSFTYTNLDAANTSLTVTGSAGGTLASIGGGEFEGLWFGSDQSSGVYSFTFSSAVNFFEIRINAMSTFGDLSETIGNFQTNAPSLPTLAYTNVQNTAWDGTTVTSGPQDNGEFILDVTAAAGQSFNTVSFDHVQVGSPNGSVVRDIQYQVASVPEPETWALMFGGLALMGFIANRRQRSSRG